MVGAGCDCTSGLCAPVGNKRGGLCLQVKRGEPAMTPLPLLPSSAVGRPGRQVRIHRLQALLRCCPCPSRCRPMSMLRVNRDPRWDCRNATALRAACRAPRAAAACPTCPTAQAGACACHPQPVHAGHQAMNGQVGMHGWGHSLAPCALCEERTPVHRHRRSCQEVEGGWVSKAGQLPAPACPTRPDTLPALPHHEAAQ